jgi:hypothetical protein
MISHSEDGKGVVAVWYWNDSRMIRKLDETRLPEDDFWCVLTRHAKLSERRYSLKSVDLK